MSTFALPTKCAWRVLAVVILLMLGAVPASADGPLSLVTITPIGSVSHGLALQDGFLYVATDAGLTVLDVSTPGAPVVRGSVATAGNQSVIVRGRYAYLAGAGGFRIVDVADPDHPVLVATRAAYFAWNVALKDDVAFVVSFAGEMYLFDVSDPTNPVQRRVIGLPVWRPDAAADANGLAALNAYTTSGNAKATGVVVKGNSLVAVDWAFGRVYAYDVSVPLSPIFRGTHFVPYILDVDLDLERDVIFLVSAYSYHSGVYTVPLSFLRPDVSTTYASCAACSYLPSTVPGGMDQGGMALAPGGAYLVYGGGKGLGELHVVDVRDPRAMQYAAPMSPIGSHGVGLAGLMAVAIHGDHAYFAAGTQGVQVYAFPGLSGDAGLAGPSVVEFALNGGASNTTSRLVTLTNTVVGGATEYRAAESSDLSDAAWLPYATAPGFPLSGGNGTKQVFFQVRNAAGLESAVKSDTISLQEPVPTVTAFAINGGATTTTTRTVVLDNTATNGPTEYRASESSTFVGADWTAYAAAPSFTLSPGNVTKRVYFQTRNAAGVSAVRSDTIVLSEPVPVLTSVLINGGAPRTRTRTVTLDHVASGAPATEYRASESSTFAGASWQPSTPAPLFTLSAGMATKRVYLQLRNAAGALSVVRSDTIILEE